MEKDLRHLSVLYAWAHANGIELEKRVCVEANLSNREIDNSIDAARIDFRASGDLPSRKGETKLSGFPQSTVAPIGTPAIARWADCSYTGCGDLSGIETDS